MEYRPHAPVMLHEVVEALVVRPDGTYLDATAGNGGHAEEILKQLSSKGRVIALDRDKQALDRLRDRFAGEGRVTVVAGNFRDIAVLPEVSQQAPFSGALFDFGVSSHQIDEPTRGFSFQREGPLDMRMDRSEGITAEEVVNQYDLNRLSRLLREFGEVVGAGKMARQIISARPIGSTLELSKVIRAGSPDKSVKVLAQVFQALRIEVNGELEAIDRGLEAIVDLLEPGGRLVVLSYHSLEDRRVKRFIRRESGESTDRMRVPVELRTDVQVRMKPIGRKSTKPSSEEVELNPRARSARMRVAEKAS